MSRLLTIAACCAALACGCASFDPAAERSRQSLEFRSELSEMEAKLLASPLSLADCVAIAMTNNYMAKFADLYKEFGRISRRMAYSAFLPQVAASAGYIEYEKEPVLSSKDFWHGSVNAGWAVFQPASWFMYDAAKNGEVTSEMAAAYVRQGIVLKTTRNYYNVLVQEDLIKAYEAQVSAAEEIAARVAGLAKEGMARNWEYARAESAATARRADLNRARRNLTVLKGNLLTELGLSPLAKIELSGKDKPPMVPKGEIEDLVLKALEVHPRLTMADREVVISEDDVRKAICNFIPTVSLFVTPSFTRNKVGNPPIKNISFGFNAAWTLFSGFYNIGVYRLAKVERKSTEYARENAFLSVISCVISANAALEDARDAAKVYQVAYEASKLKYEDSEARGREGLIPVADVLDAKAEMNSAQVNLVLSRYNERTAVENLRLAMGITELPGEFSFGNAPRD